MSVMHTRLRRLEQRRPADLDLARRVANVLRAMLNRDMIGILADDGDAMRAALDHWQAGADTEDDRALLMAGVARVVRSNPLAE